MSERHAFELEVRDRLNRRLSGCFEMIADARMAVICSNYQLANTILRKLMDEFNEIDAALETAPCEIQKHRG